MRRSETTSNLLKELVERHVVEFIEIHTFQSNKISTMSQPVASPLSIDCWNLIGVLFVSFSPFLDMQAQNVSDCDGAILLCNDYYLEEEAALGTGDVYEFTGDCNNNAEWASVWYQFTVQQDGLLSFIIDPLNPMDDYDWGLFNISLVGCAGLGNPLTTPEVGCNSYGQFGENGPTGISSAMGGTGASNGPGDLNGPPFNADLPVEAGQTFALVVMNWSQSLEGYGIDFSGSTASLYDDVPPAIDSTKATCGLDTFRVYLSEYVLTSTIDAADFKLVQAASGGEHFFSEVLLAPPLPETINSVEFLVDPLTPIMASGEYSLQMTDVAGSVADACGNLGTGSATVYLNHLVPPWSWPDPLVWEVCPDEPEAFDATSGMTNNFEPPAGTTYSVIWTYDSGGGMSPDTLVAGATPIELVTNSEGDGLYNLDISTVPACYSASSTIVITTVECAITIPNVITPRNGDALNDAFRVEGLDRWPGSRVRIFNRWGDLVYTNDQFHTSAGWNPSAEEAAEGTYYYELFIPKGNQELRVTTRDGEDIYSPDGESEIQIAGSFSLMRK